MKNTTSRRKIFALAGFVAALSLFAFSLVQGYWYYNDFVTETDNWTLGYRYARNGFFDNGNNASTISRAGGTYLRFTGVVNTSDANMDRWTGRAAYYIGAEYSASRTAPFGVEFLRGTTQLDPHGSTSNSESDRHSVAQTFWLFNGTPPTTDGGSFANSVFMYEMMRMSANVSGNPVQPRSTWGRYVASEQRFNLKNALRPGGGSTDLTADPLYTLEWNYDDNFGDGLVDTAGTPNPDAVRPNPVGIRLTHDGSKVRFYLNPDPTGVNPYPNEYHLVGSVDVSWNSGIRFMTGIETRRHDNEVNDSDIDSVLVRSVADSMMAEIGPEKVAKGTQHDFNLVISPTFASTDSGIGELTIAKPAAYTGAWDPAAIEVYSYKGTGASHASHTSLKKMVNRYNASFTANNEAYVFVENMTNLRVRFRQTSDANTGVIRSDTGSTDEDRKIIIVMPLTTPALANGLGEQFIVYADCVKYDGQNYSRWGTTGMIQASAGDASSFIAGNSLRVKTYNDPDARSALEPMETYVGATTVYLYISTTNINSPDISELRIRIPDGYSISADNSSGDTYSSLIISDDASHVSLMTEAGTNYIRVDYKGAGAFLPAAGGMDRIAIMVAETPAGFIGATKNTVWQAAVKSEVPGTVRTVCRQDGSYANMALLVRQLPPDMVASLSTVPEGSVNTLYNNVHYNQITLAVQNNGGLGNLIKRIRIQMPPVVSAVDLVGSSIIGGTTGIGMSYDGALNQVIVDYPSQGKVFNPGQSDTIRFTIQDTVPTMSDPVSYQFPVAADNDNEEGYVAATEAAQTWAIRWKRPDAAGSAGVTLLNGLTIGSTNRIYTSTTTATRVRFGINNSGGTHNTLRLVEIVVPAQFTNIANIASTYHPTTPMEIIGNRVLVKYGEAGTGILNAQSDTISIDLKDSVGLTQNQDVEFSIRVGNTTYESNLKATGTVPGGNKKISFVRPPLMATAASLPVEINSDITTHVLTTTIINTGELQNTIGELRVFIPAAIASINLNTASSSILGENSGASANISVDTTGLSNFVRIVYPPAKPFRGGMTETVAFSIVKQPEVAPVFSVVSEASNVQNLWQRLGTTSGGTNTILFRKPPAQGGISLSPYVLYHHDGGPSITTNLIVLTLTNTGVSGNDITNAEIVFPSIMQNKVVSMSNESGAFITNWVNTQSKILVNYQNVKLQATKRDRIYIWLKTDMPSQTVNLPFTCIFDNGEGPQPASVPLGKSASLSLVTRPEIWLAQNDATPNQIYTTDTFSTFAFTFKNGQTGGKPISRLKISVPDPFISAGAVLASPWPSSTEVLVETNGRAVFVHYTTSKLDAGSSDEISIGLRDNYVIGTTNVSFTAWADYGDGGGFKPVRVTTGKSMDVGFVFPDASAYASVTPRLINMNTVSNQFTVIVTNIGVPGNHIKKLELDLGKYVTNIGIRSTTILGPGVGTVVNNRYLVIDYAASLTNLPSGYKDTITVVALDSVEEVTNVTVRVRVSNSTSDAEYRYASEQSTGGLKINYFRPDYLGSAYIEAVNRVSAEKPNTVYSTVTTSTLRYTLANDGAAGNDLDAMRLYLPTVYVNPNSLAHITSQRGGIIQRVGNVLTVWYTNGTKLASTQRDTIQFAVNDYVTATNATSHWISTARFMTSGDKFLTNQVVAGKSDSISFEMPPPSAKAKLHQRMIYATTRRFMTALDITNAGTGSNDITTVTLTLPVGMRDGMDVSKVTNSFAANKNYSGGLLTLTYTNFTVGKVDKVWLDLTNTYTDVYSGQLALTAANKVFQNAVAPLVTDALLQRVVTAPSVYAEAVNPRDGVDNRLWSTDYEAQYRVYVRNDGTGDAPLRRVRIQLPTGFVISAASSGAVGGTGLVFAGNTISIDYPAGFPFSASQWDAITLTAADPWSSGASVASFAVLVGGIDQIDGVDINTNYAATRLYVGKSLSMDYVHPPVSTQYWIDGFGSGTKPFAYVAPKGGTSETNIIVKLKNTGTQSNVVHRVRFNLPAVFSGISGVTSSVNNALPIVSGSTVEITYPVEKLQAGQTDTLSLTLRHAETDATNNLLFLAQADNADGKGYAGSLVLAGGFATMDIKYPPISIFAGIKNLTSIYTINTNATFSYQVRNRAQGYNIFRTVLTNQGWQLFDTVTASSSHGGSVTVEKSAGRIVIDYLGAGLLFNETDSITLAVTYRITNDMVRTNTLESIVYLTNNTLQIQTNLMASELEAIDTDTGSKDNQRYTIGPAPYGIFSGSILPVFKTDKKSNGSFLPNIVKIEMITATNNTVVTTPYLREVGSDGSMQNSTLVVYSDPMDGGSFTLPFVPEGNFRLRMSADGFRLTLTNVTALANRIQKLERVMLKNDYLDSNLTNNQIVVDYGDTNTRFILGSGTLLDQFSLDISVVDMQENQESDVMRNRLVLTPPDTSLLGCFRFEIRDRLNISVPGVGVGGDGIVQLHYTATNLNLPITSGTWQEDKLGIWYWKETTSEWIPVGGLVDSVKQTVSAKVNYLHNYYAVLSVRPEAVAQKIYNVKASPNPFTPGRGGENSSKLKLTFSFSKEHATYSVSIYNMRGQKIREFTRDGTYRQGEVFWDGRHENGFALPGGVYLYQIRAGGETFSGSVLVLK